jgi:hypothetical protein
MGKRRTHEQIQRLLREADRDLAVLSLTRFRTFLRGLSPLEILANLAWLTSQCQGERMRVSVQGWCSPLWPHSPL